VIFYLRLQSGLPIGASIPALLREEPCASDKAEAASFTEFLKNVVDVNFDGAWTEPQFASDILIRQTATNQKRDFVFSRTQYSQSLIF
jgi:hypothetical protein